MFRELKILEPYGIRNLVPKILVKNCCFKISKNKNSKQFQNNVLKYIKAEVTLYDSSSEKGFPGVWWGHYRKELQISEDKRYDAILELGYNKLQPGNYEVRLVEIKEASHCLYPSKVGKITVNLLDYRNSNQTFPNNIKNESVKFCPVDWQELFEIYSKSCKKQKNLSLLYSYSINLNSTGTIQKAIDIANFLSFVDKTIMKEKLQKALSLSNFSLMLVLNFLENFGFLINKNNEKLSFTLTKNTSDEYKILLQKLIEVIEEENFKKKYFTQIPIKILENFLVHGNN